MPVEIALGVVTLASLSVAGYAWWHTSKWAKLIAYGRIVVEYKHKVKIDASLQEWALWTKATEKDRGQVKALRGHVIYAMGGTRVALFRGVKPAKVKPVKERPGQTGKQIRRGKWNATDETEANQKAIAQADRRAEPEAVRGASSAPVQHERIEPAD